MSNSANEEVSVGVEEDCWDLPNEFDLYAKHEVGKIHFPGPSKDGCKRFKSTHAFLIECIEPDSPLDLLNSSHSASKYDATGHCIWAGAFLLIHSIHELKKFAIANKRIIEFGTGTGIGGLAIMLADTDDVPLSVAFTDNDPDALDVCRRNCELNNIPATSYSIEELTWGTGATKDDFDVALATDVLYDVDLIDPLFTSVTSCIRLNGIFILSHIPRACYNEGNPPEAIEDLEGYIVDQAKKIGLDLDTIIRPPLEDEILVEQLEWCPKTAFAGGAILVFRRVV